MPIYTFGSKKIFSTSAKLTFLDWGNGGKN